MMARFALVSVMIRMSFSVRGVDANVQQYTEPEWPRQA
jgi:hypothetical protein